LIASDTSPSHSNLLWEGRERGGGCAGASIRAAVGNARFVCVPSAAIGFWRRVSAAARMVRAWALSVPRWHMRLAAAIVVRARARSRTRKRRKVRRCCADVDDEAAPCGCRGHLRMMRPLMWTGLCATLVCAESARLPPFKVATMVMHGASRQCNDCEDRVYLSQHAARSSQERKDLDASDTLELWRVAIGSQLPCRAAVLTSVVQLYCGCVPEPGTVNAAEATVFRV